MAYKEKYQGVKPVYHNRITGHTSYTRIEKEQTCFDSTSEFKLYLLLEEYLPQDRFLIECHPVLNVGTTSWNIDFRVSVDDNDFDGKTTLANIINAIHYTDYRSLSQIFLEYKGLQDDNFIKKMSSIAYTAPLFTKSIILVSSKVGAFGCYDETKCKFYCHPIASTSILESIFQRHIEVL